MLRIRKASTNDLNAILDTYSFAREQMKMNGNPTQWGNTRPERKVTEKDIELQILYVIENEKELCGVFVFFVGDDPTYHTIWDGNWIDQGDYGVVHRIASNGKEKGIMNAAFDFAESQCRCVRGDTHRDNRIMQHLFMKRGYTKCGTILTDDGTERIAYQKICET